MVPVTIPAHFHDIYPECTKFMRQSFKFFCRADSTRKFAHLRAECVREMSQRCPTTDRTIPLGNFTVVLRRSQQHRVRITDIFLKSTSRESE